MSIVDSPHPHFEALAQHAVPQRAIFSTSVGLLLDIRSDGRLVAGFVNSEPVVCEWVCSGDSVELKVGDRLLITCTVEGSWVALGRLGAYQPPQPQTHAYLTASESLSIRCGESSIEMRADGKVLIKGDDVTVRAKGTKRIRAGSVSIN